MDYIWRRRHWPLMFSSLLGSSFPRNPLTNRKGGFLEILFLGAGLTNNSMSVLMIGGMCHKKHLYKCKNVLGFYWLVLLIRHLKNTNNYCLSQDQSSKSHVMFLFMRWGLLSEGLIHSDWLPLPPSSLLWGWNVKALYKICSILLNKHLKQRNVCNIVIFMNTADWDYSRVDNLI